MREKLKRQLAEFFEDFDEIGVLFPSSDQLNKMDLEEMLKVLYSVGDLKGRIIILQEFFESEDRLRIASSTLESYFKIVSTKVQLEFFNKGT